MATINLSKSAEKAFFKLKPSDQKKISKAIDKLEKDPLAGEKLKGDHEGEYKLYAWPYRVIYIFDPEADILEVLAISHRQGAYKK